MSEIIALSSLPNIKALCLQLKAHENYAALSKNIHERMADRLNTDKPGSDFVPENLEIGDVVVYLDPSENFSSGFFTVASLPERIKGDILVDDDTIGLSSHDSSCESFMSDIYKKPENDLDFVYMAMFANRLNIDSVTGLDEPAHLDLDSHGLAEFYVTTVNFTAFQRKFTVSMKLKDSEDGERHLVHIYDSNDGRILLDDEQELLLSVMLYSIHRLRETYDRPEVTSSNEEILAFENSISK